MCFQNDPGNVGYCGVLLGFIQEPGHFLGCGLQKQATPVFVLGFGYSKLTQTHNFVNQGNEVGVCLKAEYLFIGF